MAADELKNAMALEQVEDLKASAQHSHDRDGHAAGNALLFDKQGNIRKLPIPSHDPNDPLNFSRWEKFAIIFCCCWFCKSLMFPWRARTPCLLIGGGEL
jgi:hypothetical protein